MMRPGDAAATSCCSVVPEARDAHRRLHRPRVGGALGRRRRGGRRLDARARAARSILGTTLESSPAGARQGGGPAHRPLPPGGPRGADVRDQEDGRSCSTGPARRATRDAGRAASTSSATRRTCACSRRSAASCDDPPTSATTPTSSEYGNTAGAGAAVGALDALGRVDGRRTTSRSSASAPGLTWSSYLLRFGARGAVKYAEFRAARSASTTQELLAFAPRHASSRTRPRASRAQLPLPPMLMVDRIVEIRRERHRGPHRRRARRPPRRLVLPVPLPRRPGAAGLPRRRRASGSSLGFFCAWAGGLGAGRALGCGEVEFSGQIRPHDARRALRGRRAPLRRARRRRRRDRDRRRDASLVDGEPIYTIKRRQGRHLPRHRLRRLPAASARSRGGRMER